VYFTTAAGSAIHDRGSSATELPGIVGDGEQALGLAYDFNTDHLFVRLAPAQIIRVIERPSGKMLREMPLPAELLPGNLPKEKVAGTNTGPVANGNVALTADLAIRSSDRHLFAAHPDGRSVVELTLFGKFARRLELRGLDAPVGGLAYDQKNRRLLVLSASSPARIGFVDPAGNVTYYVTFQAAVSAVSLGYDSDAQHFFVPLADGQSLGEFDASGKLTATHPAGGSVTAVDAGPRSLVRVF